jgi:hypothetical protein
MLQVIQQTDEEQYKMYMESCTKEELASMLVQANKMIDQHPITFQIKDFKNEPGNP